MFSQIVITFNSESIAGDVIGFKSRKYEDGVDTGLFIDQYETFQTAPRASRTEIQVVGVIGTPPGTASARRFSEYWGLDFNVLSIGAYSVEQIDNVVTITYLTDETILFSDFSGGSSATAVINNVSFVDFTLVEQIISPVDDIPEGTFTNIYLESESIGLTPLNENDFVDIIPDAIAYPLSGYFANKVVPTLNDGLSTYRQILQNDIPKTLDIQNFTFSVYAGSAGDGPPGISVDSM